MVHDALREAILQGEIGEGAWLSQVQIAKELGTSRGPVREAFRMLQREGLIEAQVNQRARVGRFSADDLEHLYANRIVTESLAISFSVGRFTDEELAELALALEEMETATGDIAAWELIHRRFHLGLVRHAGERMVQVVAQHIDHSERYRRVYITTGPRVWIVGAEEHREIFEACAARNAPLAGDLLARHLCRTALTVFMLAAPEHDPALLRAAIRQTSDGSLDDQPGRRATLVADGITSTHALHSGRL